MTAARQFIMLSQVKINVIKIDKVCKMFVLSQVKINVIKIEKVFQMFVHYKNYAKSRESMRKCAKT